MFGAMVALALFGVMLVMAMGYAEEWSHGRRHAAAARDLVVLARAARAHAANDLEDLRASTGPGGLNEVALAALKSDGWLLSGFRETNALGQGYRVFHRRTGLDGHHSAGLDVLVTTQTPAGTDVGYRLDSGYEGGREIFVGVVDPGALEVGDRGRLLGPAVDADVSGYRATYGAPGIGETAALTGLTVGSVYGSELHRVVVDGRPEANRMETDLVMGGNDIVGAQHIETVEAEIVDELRVLGGLEVINELTVGQRLRVVGESVFEGDLTARDGAFSGAVASASGEVRSEIRAQTLTVSGVMTAQTVQATVGMTAPEVTGVDVHATQVVAADVSSDSIEARVVQSQLVNGTTVTGDAGVFGTIHTGSCAGC